MSQPLPYPQTPKTAQAWMNAHGICISSWARGLNLPRDAVVDALRGRLKGNRGTAHLVAVALGLKPDPVNTPVHEPRKESAMNTEEHATTELVLPVRLLAEQVEFSVRLAEMLANDAVRSYRENRIDWLDVDETLRQRLHEIDKVDGVVGRALAEDGRGECLAARVALRDQREAAKARIQALRDDLRANCSLFNALAQVAA